MKRIVGFLVIIAGTFYLSLIYKSDGLIFLGYTEIVVMSLLLIYNILGLWQIRILLEAPLGITERGKKVPVKIKIQNYGRLPTGKIAVQLLESYAFYGKKRKTFFYASAAGKKYNEECSTVEIRTWWQPGYTGKVVISVRKVRCFDLLGAMCLSPPKSAYSSSEVITVLPAIYHVPIDIGETVRNFAAEQERYLQYDAGDTATEQFQIRGYQPGDRIRSIHWKLSAKEGELMVKEYQPVKRCPVLFFLDLAGEMRKKENKEEIRNRELFFTVMVSLSDSMIKQGCKHYVIWYDGPAQDVMRCRVEQEEDIYTLFAAVNGIAVLPPNYDLEEEYYDKYRERLYASKLVLKRNLQLACNGEQIINYKAHDIKESLAAQTVYL
ncbi:DUF58 domain-containing protein [bacterium 1xD8-6]|jgi:Uncharacterized conserved protein (some members contain a von Willebrand factor type A (vWA) domain)|nr:DUF58 domain-containing protein [bacterium D16-36]RKI68502.1 DUF58 domain-containing protein [bacterium 1xD8-6]